MPDDKPLPRRRFFRDGLAELLRPLAKSVEPFQRVAEQIGNLEQEIARLEPVPARRTPEEHWLRPPGSLPEQQFREQCSRCGECVRVCPSHAIKLDYASVKGEGVPYIEPAESPCVMCAPLACMNHCPSGALQQVMAEYIDMGVAVWHEHTCLRLAGADECTICVDVCPVGARAIQVDTDGRIAVKDGCTGCGTCEHHCPTAPKSITVTPKSAR